MLNSKIFLDNFFQLSLQSDIQKTTGKLIVGYHHSEYEENVHFHAKKEILRALLLYDKIIIRAIDILNLDKVFGTQETIKLLSSGRFELIDEKTYLVSIYKKDDNSSYKFSELVFPSYKTDIERIEAQISLEKNSCKIDEIKSLLLNIDKYTKYEIEPREVYEKLEVEINYDLNNQNLTNHFNIISKKSNNIVNNDIYQFLRLANLNRALLYTTQFKFDATALDGAIKNILLTKLTPILLEKDFTNESINNLFTRTFDRKLIPDFTDLYVKKIINLDDILELSSHFEAKKFKQWIKSSNFDYKVLEADMLKSQPKLKMFPKLIKWVIPNVIGIIEPLSGIIASGVDGFIIDKLFKNWHPNFFLDDILKKNIDVKVAESKRNKIYKMYPNIETTSLCPCKSGKKLKDCCLPKLSN